MPFANGENVGAYRIVEKLGQGGMATVYKAYHPALDRYVAIKVMHPAFMEDPNFLARFQREARIVAKLDHPHIVPIYDFAEHSGHPYLVMRFVEGETLKARLQRGSLDTQEVLHIARAVGGALTYAHEQGVLHRDIKPSNILLTPEGDRSSGSGVYLTDFGLARMAEAGESTLSRDMMVGTPQYISPEQAKGLTNLDARTDVYSLGVVLYEILVGRAPFTADTPYAIVHDHIFTPLPLPRELNPDLSEPVERMLLKALAKKPDDRFQSAKELIGALESTLQSAPPPETIVAPPPPPKVAVTPPPTAPPSEVTEEPAGKKPKKKKRRWPWVAAAIVVLCTCLVAFLCLAVVNKRQQIGGLMEEARIAWGEGDLEDALQKYNEVVKLNPRVIPAYIEASEVFVEMGDVDGALDALKRGVDANPDDLELHVQRAGIAILEKRWPVADEEMRWLSEKAPEDFITLALDSVKALIQGEACEQVRPNLDLVLEMDPELPWGQFGVALCLRQEGNIDAARSELESFLSREDIPFLLRKRAEETLADLERGPQPPEEESVEWHLEIVIRTVGGIPDDELRQTLKDILNEARRAWEEGDKDHAIQMAREAILLVRENRDAIGPQRARVIDISLTRIVDMATEGPPP
jgi:serine/threonine protein kinase